MTSSQEYNASGTELWWVNYSSSGNSDDLASALAIDQAGNVYVTGSSVAAATGYDYATIKYSFYGDQEWVARYYNSPGYASDQATDLAVDESGNVYVTGWSADPATGNDYATIKYNSSGARSWVVRYSGPGNFTDAATALAVAGSGDVCVTGYSWDAVNSEDFITIRYSPDGALQWVARYNGPANKLDMAVDLALDGSENVYVTGSSSPSAVRPFVSYYDYATVKYNSAGIQQWNARYGGPENSTDLVHRFIKTFTNKLLILYITSRTYSRGNHATKNQESKIDFNGRAAAVVDNHRAIANGGSTRSRTRPYPFKVCRGQFDF
jgi:hypothetical protein